MSSASVKVWPQNRGKVGKHSEASRWLTSMSSSRGFDLVGAGSHVLVGDAPHGHLVAGHAHRGVDPEQRSLEILVVPPVGGEALRSRGPR